MSGFEGFPPPQGSGGGGGYGMGDDPTFGDVTADTLVLDAANGDAFLSRAAAGRVRAGTSPTNANGQLQAALLLTASSTMALANATGLELGDVRTVSWGDSTLYTSTKDLYLRRASASVLQIDADGAGAAATLAVASVAFFDGTFTTYLAQTGANGQINVGTTNGGVDGSLLCNTIRAGNSGYFSFVTDDTRLSRDAESVLALKGDGGADAAVRVYQDDGSTYLGYTSLTSSPDTTTPTLSALPTGGTASQVGWIQIDVNGTTSYVPYWQ